MAALVDTNVLVYRFDERYPDKQVRATALLRAGLAEQTLKVPHQAVVEFVSVVSRPARGGAPILPPADARREAETLLAIYEVLYPTEDVVRVALRGAANHQLSWYDAHLWAYAEHFGLDTLYSEDFQHGRRYGSVRVLNPFA